MSQKVSKMADFETSTLCISLYLLSPLHWAPGIEWITESSRVVFEGLIGLGVTTTTLVLFSILHPHVDDNYMVAFSEKTRLRYQFLAYAKSDLYTLEYKIEQKKFLVGLASSCTIL